MLADAGALSTAARIVKTRFAIIAASAVIGSAALISSADLVVSPDLLATAQQLEGDGPTSKAPDGTTIHHAYADPAHGWRVPTICQGRTRGVFRGMTATADQCEVWLAEEYRSVVLPALARNVKQPITQRQGNALALFTDNVGETNLRSSQLLRHINAGRCLAAAAEFNASPQMQAGKPVIWRGSAIVWRSAPMPNSVNGTVLYQRGDVLIATGQPVMKWTTAAGQPLPGLIARRAIERAMFEADCDTWETP